MQSGRSLQDILNSQSSAKYSRNKTRQGYQKNKYSDRRSQLHKHDNQKKHSNKKVENSIVIDDLQQFPELLVKKSQELDNNSLDYKDIINKNEVKNSDIYSEKSIPGWSTINRKTKQVITYDKLGYKVNKTSNNYVNESLPTITQIYSTYEKLAKHWCEYYDSINDLLGDRSPYVNYKDEIEKIVEEDDDLFKKMYEDVDENISSDDEFNYDEY